MLIRLMADLPDPEPAIGTEEPTVVDRGTGASGPRTSSVSGATGVDSAVSFAGSPTSMAAATSVIIAGEEHTRTIALFRLVLVAGLAGLFAIWLQPKPSPGRLFAAITCGVTVLVSTALLVRFRERARFDARLVLLHGMLCVVTTLAVTYYVGVFSPAVISMCIGIYYFGLGDDTRSALIIYVSGALGYLALNTAALVGWVDTSAAVLALHEPAPEALIAVTLVCQVLFYATYSMARYSRSGTLKAFERLERAARQIRQRDALLDEARAELEGGRGAKLGRFTDQQIGRYTVGEIIGRGAMGEVYSGFDVDKRQAVALKFLNAALAGEPESVQRFFREVDVASRLESRHVVTVLDHGMTESGAPFLVMELLQGRDLGQHLREKKRLGMSAVVELTLQVADALSVADQAKIVHRDLKPQNLFLSEGGTEREWKVLDFGVSKILDGAENLTLGAAVGTPSYMSPEQARGGDVDHRADVFALGVIIYRTLTGRPAFTASDSVATLYNVVHAQPARPSEFVRMGADVERVLALALAKDPERRFSSALMLATALREAARDRLDPRLRQDADALIGQQPWGKSLTPA